MGIRSKVIGKKKQRREDKEKVKRRRNKKNRGNERWYKKDRGGNKEGKIRQRGKERKEKTRK